MIVTLVVLLLVRLFRALFPMTVSPHLSGHKLGSSTLVFAAIELYILHRPERW